MATNVGTVTLKLGFDTKSIATEQSSVQAQVEKGWTKTGATIANVASQAITKAMGIVSEKLSSAISRLDTINNFPTVMQAVGYSADEAQSSVDSLSDHLDGLPTSLDDAVSNVQILAASMGNLNEGTVNATTVAEAFNDAMLAGGQGTEAASSAFTQYSQMLAVGKVDQMAWNNLVRTAPAQMDELAKSILGATAGQGELYQAMQAGTVTFDDFNAALVQLDTQGTDSFASFYDQAVSATGGIQTQLDLVSTSITKVIADALNGDDMEKHLDQLVDRVNNVVPKIVKAVIAATGAIIAAVPAVLPDLVQAIVDCLPGIVDAARDLVIGLANALPDILFTIANAIQPLAAQIYTAIANMLPQLVQQVGAMVMSLVTALTSPSNLQLVLQASLKLLIEVVKAIPQLITALADALPTLIENLVSFLTDPANIAMILDAAVQLFFALVLAVPQILGSLLNAFGTLVGDLWNGITSMFGQFAANFGNFIGDIFRNAINGVLDFIEGFINTPINILNGFIGVINDAFGGVGVNLDYISTVSLPRLAQGGIANGATAAIIGEAGQEAVLPLENNTDNWSGLLADTLLDAMEERGGATGGGIIVNQTNYINNELDADDIGRRMMTSIRRSAL